MTLDEYQKKANKFNHHDSRRFQDKNVALLHYSVGFGKECGELMRVIKEIIENPDWFKCIKKNFINELGDVLWYISKFSNELGINLSEVARKNLKNLEHKNFLIE